MSTLTLLFANLVYNIYLYITTAATVTPFSRTLAILLTFLVDMVAIQNAVAAAISIVVVETVVPQ